MGRLGRGGWRAVVVALGLAGGSCQSGGPGGEAERDGDPAGEAGGAEAVEEIRDAHRERFAGYEVEAPDVPKLARYTIKVDSEDPIVIRHAWFELVLVLGRRIETEVAGRFRTGSRYRLMTGKAAVEAESVFAWEDLAERGLVRTTMVCHDGETGEVFLYEEHSGSVRRFILLHPAPGGARVSYVELPFLRPTPPAGSFAILGIRGGMIYAEQEGVIYRYPLRELLEIEELSFSIG